MYQVVYQFTHKKIEKQNKWKQNFPYISQFIIVSDSWT